MLFHAPIGVYDFERRDGNDISVDVRLTIAEQTTYDDDIADTVNYADVYQLVKGEVCKPANLLETVANRIRLALAARYPQVLHYQIRVSKLNPPVGGHVGDATIELKD